MQKKTIAIILGVVVVLAALWLAVAWPDSARVPEPVPPAGDETGEPEDTKSDPIRVDFPKPNDLVESPLVITGEARGTWYFEASFPVRLLDANGTVLVQHYAEAQADWMTSEFVPFRSTITFAAPETDTGVLILEKDNPSGLPEHADEIRIPVRFRQAVAGSGCVITGCSGHVCAEESMITTCEFLPAYACYRTARCERQANGACGWTDTAELRACLDAAGT